MTLQAQENDLNRKKTLKRAVNFSYKTKDTHKVILFTKI